MPVQFLPLGLDRTCESGEIVRLHYTTGDKTVHPLGQVTLETPGRCYDRATWLALESGLKELRATSAR